MSRQAAVTDALLDFTLQMHRALEPDPDRDACWSPYSVAVALGMAATAARGRTRDELLTVLGAAAGAGPGNTEPGDAALGGLADTLAAAAQLDPEQLDPEQLGPGQAELRLAATAWLRENVEVTDGFADALVRWPSGALRSFGTDLRSARERINADVAETTRGLIRELLGDGVLGPHTVAVLVSALYLKAAWADPFDQHLTRPRRFHAPCGPVEVPTMELVAGLGYARTDRWQVVTLPARGGVQAMILLPHASLADAEAGLSATELAAVAAGTQQRGTQRIRLRLPRLRLEHSARLSGPLAALGAGELFDRDRADLTGLSPQRPAWVDEVVHRSVLRIDEQGLEGAAATAVIVAMRALVTPPAEPLLVEVDRPFLLLVRHPGTGMIYFLARVTDPG